MPTVLTDKTSQTDRQVARRPQFTVVGDQRTTGGPKAAQSGNQGEGRDQEDDHAEDGKTT